LILFILNVTVVFQLINLILKQFLFIFKFQLYLSLFLLKF